MTTCTQCPASIRHDASGQQITGCEHHPLGERCREIREACSVQDCKHHPWATATAGNRIVLKKWIAADNEQYGPGTHWLEERA